MRPSHKTLALILLCGTLALAGYEIGANRRANAAGQAGQAATSGAADQSAPGDSASANAMPATPASGGSNSVGSVGSSAGVGNSPGSAANSAGGATNSAGAAMNSPGPQPSQQQQLTVPEGTRIDVRLTDAVGSALDRTGQRFAATLAEPIEVDGSIVVPQGANVTGRVIEARPSGHLRTPALLAVTLTSIEINGQWYDVSTSHRSWRGKSHKKRNILLIAGATGAGALVGGLVGAGKGVAIGAGVGAGGGTATAYATGKRNIVLPSETRLRFVLRQPLTVTQA